MTSVTRQAVAKKIRELLESLKPETTLPVDTTFEGLNLSSDLGLDSLDMINVLFQLEEAFGVKVPDDDDDLLNIEALCNFIVKNSDPA